MLVFSKKTHFAEGKQTPRFRHWSPEFTHFPFTQIQIKRGYNPCCTRYPMHSNAQANLTNSPAGREQTVPGGQGEGSVFRLTPWKKLQCVIYMTTCTQTRLQTKLNLFSVCLSLSFYSRAHHGDIEGGGRQRIGLVHTSKQKHISL